MNSARSAAKTINNKLTLLSRESQLAVKEWEWVARIRCKENRESPMVQPFRNHGSGERISDKLLKEKMKELVAGRRFGHDLTPR